MGSHEVAVDAEEVSAAHGEMEDGFGSDFGLDEMGDCPRAHTHLGAGGIGDVDNISACLFEDERACENVIGIETARGVHLDADDEMSGVEFLLELGGRVLNKRLGGLVVCRDCRDAGAFAGDAGVGIEGEAHLADVLGGGAAAAADEVDACFGKAAGVIAEIVGGSRIENASAAGFGETCVGLGGEIDESGSARVVADGVDDLFEDVEQAGRSDGTVDADDVDFEGREGVGNLNGGIAVGGDAVVGKGHLGDDGDVGEFLRRADGFGDFGKVGKGFENEGVGVFGNEGGDLFTKGVVCLITRDSTDGRELDAERSDGGDNECVFAGGVDSGAGEPDACGVDFCHLIFEPVFLEFEAVGAKGVGLDDLSARAQIFFVKLPDERGLFEVERVKALFERDAVGVEEGAGGAVAQ